jgi:hypothetical protein
MRPFDVCIILLGRRLPLSLNLRVFAATKSLLWVVRSCKELSLPLTVAAQMEDGSRQQLRVTAVYMCGRA